MSELNNTNNRFPWRRFYVISFAALLIVSAFMFLMDNPYGKMVIVQIVYVLICIGFLIGYFRYKRKIKNQ